MPTMKELYGTSQVASAKPLDPAEIPDHVEIDLTLYAAPHKLRRSEGMSRAQFRGWMDEAGTVRARVYKPGSPANHAGEIVQFGVGDAGFSVAPDERNEGLSKVEYTEKDGTLVIVWLPEDAEVSNFKLTLGIG